MLFRSFAVDYDTKTATCPQGKTSVSWTPCTQRGKDAIVATFSASDCGSCPARNQCTTGKRRQLTLLPRDLAEAQAAARSAETTIPFQADYARRAGVEGTMHQAASHGARRARYRGLPKPVYMACAQPPPARGILDRHAARPAANQPPGMPRTRPRRMTGITTRIAAAARAPLRNIRRAR